MSSLETDISFAQNRFNCVHITRHMASRCVVNGNGRPQIANPFKTNTKRVVLFVVTLCCQSAGRPGPTGLAGAGRVKIDRVASLAGKFLGTTKYGKNGVNLSVLALQHKTQL